MFLTHAIHSITTRQSPPFDSIRWGKFGRTNQAGQGLLFRQLCLTENSPVRNRIYLRAHGGRCGTGRPVGPGGGYAPTTAQPFPNNQGPTSRFLQYAKAAETYFPGPNSTAIPENNYVKVMTNPVDMNQVTAKMDYNSGAKDRLYGQFTFLLL